CKGQLCRMDEVGYTPVHVGASHLAGSMHRFGVRKCGGSKHLPIAGLKRLVHAFPCELGRAFPTGVSELEGDLRLAIAVYKLDNAPPRGFVLRLVHSSAAERDACFRRNTSHLRENEPCASKSTCA